MKRTFLFPGCLSIALGLAAQLPAQILVNESFEGYTTTAQMQANWGASGPGVLVSTNGYTGNSAFHPGGTVNGWVGSSLSVKPDATKYVTLSADIYDSNVGGLQRETVGLRFGSSPLFEMGHYNTSNSMYAVRFTGMYGQVGAWTFFPGVTRQAGWNHYEATFSLGRAMVTLDLGADGTVDSTIIFAGNPSANSFTDLRFGGPSGNTSVAPAWFDNIVLQSQVPEPSSTALAICGGLLVLGVLIRRRRE
jgi:hypothetical protein